MTLQDEIELEAVAAEYGGEALPAWKSGVSAAALMAMHFPPIRYVVQGLIAEGLSVLAGAPKARKSWMMLDVAHAVASGGDALGSAQCEHGDVLYLALEDNQRRLQDRLHKMGIGKPPERLTFCTDWPVGDEAVAEITAWARAVQRPTLVIIDVLARIREATGREASYEADYRALVALHDAATTIGIAIVVVHHTRKAVADDPFDEVSGTRGLTGAADTVLVLRRDNSSGPSFRATLHGRGRDIAEIESAIEFSDADYRWRIMGDAWAVADTAEQQAILDLLESAGEPMQLADICGALGKSKSNVSNMLRKMVDAGLVSKPSTGCYAPMNPVKPINDGGQGSPHSSNSSPHNNNPGEGWIGESPSQTRARLKVPHG